MLDCSLEELEKQLRQDSADKKYHLMGDPPVWLKDEFDVDGHTHQVCIV